MPDNRTKETYPVKQQRENCVFCGSAECENPGVPGQWLVNYAKGKCEKKRSEDIEVYSDDELKEFIPQEPLLHQLYDSKRKKGMSKYDAFLHILNRTIEKSEKK